MAADPPSGTAERLHEEPATAAHRATSDAYLGGLRRDDRFDVTVLDDPRTLEQTPRDPLSAGALQRHPGVIVVDDVQPDSLAASLRESRWAGQLRRRHPSGIGPRTGDADRLASFVSRFLQHLPIACWPTATARS